MSPSWYILHCSYLFSDTPCHLFDPQIVNSTNLKLFGDVECDPVHSPGVLFPVEVLLLLTCLTLVGSASFAAVAHTLPPSTDKGPW